MPEEKQSYFASTETTININRKDVTTISDIVPDTVYSLSWEFDLNAYLQLANIVAPRQLDENEKIHKRSSGTDLYIYNLGTDAFHTEIIVEKKFDIDNKFSLTYSNVTTAPKDTEALAMVALAKRLKVNSDSTVEVLPELKDAGNVIIDNSVNSTISVVRDSAVSSGVGDSLSDATQDNNIKAFLNLLKVKVSGMSWYYPDAGGLNARGMGTQVKGGLAQLFDRDAQLNNLLGSSANAGVFLDLKKIEDKMENITTPDDFNSKMFSENQLKEVLDAVYDKGDRVGYDSVADLYLYRFATGDSITCVIRVTDSDTRPNTETNGVLGNSDRWLLTLKQKADTLVQPL
jgi:hypothetical protein